VTPPARVGRSQYPEQTDRESDFAAELDPRDHDGAGSARGQRPSNAKVQPRTGARRRSRLPDSGRSIDKGSRVRVLDGPFCGKVGVVQELDGKGRARVMLGLLAVRVDVRELVRCAEGRSRPVLSTSHRKRMPVRS